MLAHPLTEDRRAAVTAALSRVAGGAVAVVDEQHVGHDWAPVTRLRLDRDLPGGGASVIVKHLRVPGEGHGGPPYLRREAAGLRTAARSGVAPRLLHADDGAGFLLQEDLGTWPTLQDQLLGDDPRAATAALVDTATAVGRLHATTTGSDAAHREALDGFSSDVTSGALYDFGADHWERVERQCADLRLPAGRPARTAVLRLLGRVAARGPGTALVHLDLNPTNVLVTGDGARLIDFEGSRIGHTGIDACFLHYPFPHHSSPWGVLPPETVEAADAAYRAALIANGADLLAADHDQVLADGAVVALLGRLVRLPLIARPDQARADARRRRGQIVHQVETCARLTERAGGLTALTGWLRSLGEALTLRWPAAAASRAPVFPAFSG
ncbi:phosphotransferase family protein [Promicromonospora sp. NPDC090134]|uniref:phosphotransferase family protein n=1 Tax=Promicromonospora sp. NPDC090134 TaxID=3364408 RepID=UPI00381A14D2